MNDRLCPSVDSLWAERPLEAATLILHPVGRRDAPVWRVERRRDGAMIGQASLIREGAEGRLFLSFDDDDAKSAAEALRRLLRLCFRTLELDRVDANGAGKDSVGLLFPLDRASWEIGHARRPKVLVVAAALIDPDGRVLLAQRPEGKGMAGLWEFPGGKVDAQETPEEALVRELHEELGLDVGESCLAPLGFVSHDYDSFHLMMPLYACRVWNGIPQGKEGQNLAWVAPARLSDYPMPPADVPLLAQLRAWL